MHEGWMSVEYLVYFEFLSRLSNEKDVQARDWCSGMIKGIKKDVQTRD